MPTSDKKSNIKKENKNTSNKTEKTKSKTSSKKASKVSEKSKTTVSKKEKSTRSKSKKSVNEEENNESIVNRKIDEIDTIKASQIILEEIKEFNERKAEMPNELDEVRNNEINNSNEKVADNIGKYDIESNVEEKNIDNNVKEDNKDNLINNNEKENNDNVIDNNDAKEDNINNLINSNAKEDNINNQLNNNAEKENSIDKEKLKEIHTELLTSRDKIQSKVNVKYTEMFRNILVAIVVVAYFIFTMYINTKFSVIYVIKYLRIASILCLIGGLILFENAYYKDKEKFFINAIEITGLGICTLYLLSQVVKQNDNINFCSSVMIASFVAYYIIKAIFIRVKK